MRIDTCYNQRDTHILDDADQSSRVAGSRDSGDRVHGFCVGNVLVPFQLQGVGDLNRRQWVPGVGCTGTGDGVIDTGAWKLKSV